MTLVGALREVTRDPRILTLDIEVSPAIVMSWGLHEQRISTDAVLEAPRVLCFAAKWIGEKRIRFHDERDGRQEMIEAAWNLLNDADIVVTYNGPSFDNKHLRREMLHAGLTPPSPWQDVDLLRVNRREFRHLSNKLGFVVDSLGLDSKEDSGGLATWKAVLDGDEKAWARMRRYCKQDVAVTEQLFHVLRPWIKLPHAGLWTGDQAGCYACASTRLIPDGVVRSKANAWLQLRCDDCGAWNRLLANGETRPA